MHTVPAMHKDLRPKVTFRTPPISFDISSILTENTRANYNDKKHDLSVQFYNLVFDEEAAVPTAHKCIVIEHKLHLRLSYY